jgi:membrane protease YdiL (CAAX protease family)
MASNQRRKARVLAALVFIALWLDGSFYPLLLLPLAFVLYYERESLAKIGLGGSGLRESVSLGLGVGLAVSVVSYPIFIHYLSRRLRTSPGLIDLLVDLVWYPVYEEVSHRGFFLASFADLEEEFSVRNLGLVLVQAFFFVLVHQNHISVGLYLLLIPVFLLGFFMGLVFLKTRSISGRILGHSLVNLVGHLLSSLMTG